MIKCPIYELKYNSASHVNRFFFNGKQEARDKNCTWVVGYFKVLMTDDRYDILDSRNNF